VTKFTQKSGSVFTKIVMDSNGNLFTQDENTNTLWGIPAGSTTPVKLITGESYQQGVAVDQYNDLIVSTNYNGQVYFFTAANVAAALAGGSIGNYLNLETASGFSALDGYYAAMADVTVDKNGVAITRSLAYRRRDRPRLQQRSASPVYRSWSWPACPRTQSLLQWTPRTTSSMLTDRMCMRSF
jgi:hypothetical protein